MFCKLLTAHVMKIINLRGGIHIQGATVNVKMTLGKETSLPVLNIKPWQEVLQPRKQ